MQSSLLELLRRSLSYVNLSKSFQNQTESLGRSPERDFFYLGALRAEIMQKLNSKINRAAR